MSFNLFRLTKLKYNSEKVTGRLNDTERSSIYVIILEPILIRIRCVFSLNIFLRHLYIFTVKEIKKVSFIYFIARTPLFCLKLQIEVIHFEHDVPRCLTLKLSCPSKNVYCVTIAAYCLILLRYRYSSFGCIKHFFLLLQSIIITSVLYFELKCTRKVVTTINTIERGNILGTM